MRSSLEGRLEAAAGETDGIGAADVAYLCWLLERVVGVSMLLAIDV